MKELVLVGVVLATSAASPVPIPAASTDSVTSVALSYPQPEHGYHADSDFSVAGLHVHTNTLVDAAGNRDVVASIEGSGKRAEQEFLLMSGLLYAKTGNTWSIATSGPPAFVAALLGAGQYPPASNYSALGHIVKSEGSAPCGTSTCTKYATSGVSKFNGQTAAVVTHLFIDQQSHMLAALDGTTFDVSGKALASVRTTFDTFAGEKIDIPDIAVSVTPTCYVADGKAAGTLDLCLYKNAFSTNFYALKAGDKLVLRASEAALANPVASPVVDGLTLMCSAQKQTQAVDPKLADSLRQSGMTDDQIAAQLGEKTVASDCTVTSNGVLVMQQHFDFK
jgi:hypothetical protein